ncbi:FecCD family ABC transporter permease [Agrococcus baldri]|uniref:ABC transporter permease n=1 Tax=Agrococcus baldri TaxID=153730 RepID=A0AA87RAH8_9MICO|nr:iron chelate uptake ABC transporter family permease subunit [Agrococcus baldri]GEK79296.1 ABC transporter permease [Agrococcus baldri]
MTRAPKVTAPARWRARPAGSRTRATRVVAVVAALAVLVVATAASVAFGARPVPLETVWAILTGAGADPLDVAAVSGLRGPRTAIAATVGIGLGLAGAIMQAVTRNPLADPGLLGVTSGSAFAVAIAIAAFGITAPLGYVWPAFGGALLATVLVFAVGGGMRGGSPERLVLAGVALGAVLSGAIAGLRLLDPETFSALQVWESGRLENRGLDVALPILPAIAIGAALAIALAPALNALALGDDLATSLGSRVRTTRALSIVAVTLLAGGATAIAGPIAFVGLMVPHIARWIVGADQRWILPLSGVLGAVLLLASDVLARVALWPGELPVGVVTAFIGAPVLIALVRRRKASGL